jgi:hypothetical protein
VPHLMQTSWIGLVVPVHLLPVAFLDDGDEPGLKKCGSPNSIQFAYTSLPRLSVALQRAISRRECAYIEKLRDRGVVPPTTCAAELLWDVQLGGARVPTGLSERYLTDLPIPAPITTTTCRKMVH